MEPNETVKLLLTRLLSLGFEEVVDEGEDVIVQRYFDRIYQGWRVPVKYRVQECHLKFIEYEERLKTEYKQIGPCWIIGSESAELLVHSSGRLSEHLVDRAISEWETISFGRESEAVIGRASDDFIGFFRFDPGFVSFLGNARPANIHGVNDLALFFEPPLTLRLRRPKGCSTFSTEQAATIADTCLFQLADLSHISLRLACEWEPSGERVIFSEDGIRPPQDLQFPKSSVSRELVNFFTRALNGAIPEYQFLGFYHCLEYFFLAVSDEVLYQRVRTHLLSPSFSVTDQCIDKIVLEVQKHRSEENEVAMLRQVLQRYISTQELRRFVMAFEDARGKKVYSEPREILGKCFRIDAAAKNVFDDLAQRIKHIRNEIVHSEDRRQRSKQRWIELDSISTDELPLMRFLAQQVIVATSKPIELL